MTVLRGLRRTEGLILSALGLWSVLPLALLGIGSPAGRFDGSDGLQVDDHLQYLAWVRQAGDHLLLNNPFQTTANPHVFLDPMLSLSGLLWRAGASVQLAYLAWKPVAVIVVFVGFAAYVRRRLGSGGWAPAVALIGALFFFSPALWVVDWLGLGDARLHFGTEVMSLEMFPGGYLWGGYSGSLAVGLMPLFVLGVERVLSTPRRALALRSDAVLTGLAGMAVSWLHPWQGLTLLVIVAGLVIWERLAVRLLTLALPVALTAAPIVYFLALSHSDSAWGAVSRSNGYAHVGLWLVVGLAPLLLALPGLIRRAREPGERMLMLWLPAALVVYFGLHQTWFYHAFVGLSLPAAILAVRGFRRLALPRLAGAAGVAALCLLGMVWTAAELDRTRGSHFLSPSDAAALSYLDHLRSPGAVLATQDLGIAVPAFTGRATWVGHYYWTPDYGARVSAAAALLDGHLAPAWAQTLVASSGARFLLAGCRHRADLRVALGPLLRTSHRFGCATVYEVGPRSPVARPRA